MTGAWTTPRHFEPQQVVPLLDDTAPVVSSCKACRSFGFERKGRTVLVERLKARYSDIDVDQSPANAELVLQKIACGHSLAMIGDQFPTGSVINCHWHNTRGSGLQRREPEPLSP